MSNPPSAASSQPPHAASRSSGVQSSVEDRWAGVDLPSATNLEYVESLYQAYAADPASVDEAWRRYFASWNTNGHSPGNRSDNGSDNRSDNRSDNGSGNGHHRPARRASGDVSGGTLRMGPSFRPRGLFDASGSAHLPATREPNASPFPGDRGPMPGAVLASLPDDGSLQHRVDQLIRNFRVRGHIIAQVDPLGKQNPRPPELDPAYYGFTERDLDRPFYTSTMDGGAMRTLRQILEQMRETYCRDIGVQFMHIDNLEVRQWLQDRMEHDRNLTQLTRKEQVRILTRLTDAVIFEEFIQRKFIGAKSFSLEGAESLIPLMDMAFERAGEQGVREVVIGMAHRGRLNVLANILGKSPQRIFREFEDLDPKLYLGGGDVKYHLGFSGDWRTRTGKNIHLSLCFNPSHLEFVNPVALGRMRAKQDRCTATTRGERGICMLIHGDAAFAGEGIVQETLNLSNLEGYTVGGTVHIIVNNQIGFTTPPREGRSTRYATDVARMLQSPIFHVNGEQPESVAQVVRLAMDFRLKFKRDVFIDMYCYRRRGHNEGDEPSYTQPRMYRAIAERENTRDWYLEHLKNVGGVSEDDAGRIVDRRKKLLERELSAARSEHYVTRPATLGGPWASYLGGSEEQVDEPETGIADRDRLAHLLEVQTRLPEDFHLHPKLKRQIGFKQEMARGERPLDWAAAESLSLASIATDGHRIRFSGQDAQRGTFSQRHALLHDANDGHEHMPLQHVAPDQAPVEIINSPLSEAAVLGFDYGYSLDCPEGLILWEAQFGDFVNVAQPIIDQFITSAEDKWNRLSGLVMLLPHGFEGQGPEHSSARLERFLNQAAEDNIQVCQPSTPAQYFHLLRRQVIRRWRKPLVVMTPKSLLRHPKCVSPLDAFEKGRYERVIADASVDDPHDVSRVLLCSGKAYYEVLERREKLGREDVAIVRLEQYFPFPLNPLKSVLARYKDDTPVFWVQEEPSNMGAWPYLHGLFCDRLFDRLPLHGLSRAASASPATGSKGAHHIEQEQLLAQAFGDG